MRAVRMHACGGPEVLRLDLVPVPTPGPGEVLVKVLSTTINHRDLWIRSGHGHPSYRENLPAVLGVDICGEVVGVGAGVDERRVGELVINHPHRTCGTCPSCRSGRTPFCTGGLVYCGSYAEYAVLPAWSAVPVDPGSDPHAAACLPNSYVTAWQMLIGKADLSPADTVLVWAGTSGVGSAAVQIAQLSGARVLTTAGQDVKLELLRSQGLHDLFDHRSPDLVEQVRGATGGLGPTIVIETVGQATWQRSLEICAPGGAIVSAGATSGDDARMNVTAMFAKQLRVLGSRVGTLADTTSVAEQFARGRLTPLIDSVIPLEDVAQAHQRLAEGGVVGKIVVEVQRSRHVRP